MSHAVYSILVSKKISKLFNGVLKVATSDWLEKKVRHVTPTGKPGVTKIKFLPTDEIERYRKMYDHKMTIDEVKSVIARYQQSLSEKDYVKLYENFMPMIYKTVRRVIGTRPVSKDDVDDLKSEASTIFTKLLLSADPKDPGLLNYFKGSLQKQLEGKSRKVFRPTVSIGPTESKLLRTVRRYVHELSSVDGEITVGDAIKRYKPDFNSKSNDVYDETLNLSDLEQMSVLITKVQPELSQANSGLIADLLQSSGVSLDEPVQETQHKLHDIIGPQSIRGDDYDAKTPEQESLEQTMRNVVKKSINSLTDSNQRLIVKLLYGFNLDDDIKLLSNEQINNFTMFMNEKFEPKEKFTSPQISELLTTHGIPFKTSGSEPMTDIARILDKSRTDVRRQFELAKLKLKRLGDIQLLQRQASVITDINKKINDCISFAYKPQSIVKQSSSTYLIDNKYVIRKFSNQLVCSCGKNCFHKDVIKNAQG